MFYLALAFSVLWVTTFAYLFILDRQISDLKKRINARNFLDISK